MTVSASIVVESEVGSVCDGLVYVSYSGSTLKLVYRPTMSTIATYTGVEDLEGLDSACDATGNVHVVYSLEYESGFRTWHMFHDASGWSIPEFIPGIDGSSLSLTFDACNCWEIVYGSWTDNTLNINYFNCNTATEFTLGTYPSVIDLESLYSVRAENGVLIIYYTLEYEWEFRNYQTFYFGGVDCITE